MDEFFDVAYERDQAGNRHHYLAVRWDHRFQGKCISYAVWGLAITRAYTAFEARCISLQPMLYIERYCGFMPQESVISHARSNKVVEAHIQQHAIGEPRVGLG